MKTIERNYWLDLFTGQTWQEFLESGAAVSGFREGRWSTVQKIKVGDYLICYLTGLSRFIGVLEVVGNAYRDSSPIWEGEDFPCRLKVKPVLTLPLENAVPVREVADKLSFASLFETNSNRWTGHFRGSPAKWKVADGEAVLATLLAAQQNPTNRPFDSAKLKRKPKALKAKIGSVTVPEVDEPIEQPSTIEVEKEATAHTEIQWLLLKLGNDMGLDVWVARNDRNRQYKNNQFNELPRIKSELPLQFDEATNKTIELIDVLWLKGNAIAAAFEIESTTSIYSGLLRMSDLISMQPNLNIPLYLVAPNERREKVFTEVNRPTFSRLSPAMSKMCRYVSFTALREQVNQVASVVRYLKPEFLEEVSESCEIEEL
jgi:predicted RNA-binding protein